MGLKIEFDIKHFRKEMDQLAAEIDNDIFESLQQAGEDFVAGARNMKKSEGGFGDVTGNLRSSIGYAIRRNGEIIFGNFDGNSTGVAAAKRAIDEVEKNNGLQLIGVAGMDYASAVESKGFNVISYQGLMLMVDLTDYMKEIEKKYNK
ncbi:MAG TPA: hypothetical protein PLC80_01310 [Draconibacterium sp.]|nr:hypothetical protein [Draconibacterium sp.]